VKRLLEYVREFEAKRGWRWIAREHYLKSHLRQVPALGWGDRIQSLD